MEAIQQFFTKNPIIGQVAELLASVVISFLVAAILLRLSGKLFKRLRRNPEKVKLNTRFLENVIRFVIIFVSVIWVVMSSSLTRSFGQTLFTGTAVLTAIAGFAAQPVLADLLCGIIISSTKPFEIGNRLTLDNGVSGIVKDMTVRHVVLQGLDTQMYIIPNSKMNGYTITNLSWKTDTRAVDFRFEVSYSADPEETIRVIGDAIRASELTVAGKTKPDGTKAYADVYFLAFRDSSLEFGTTVYYKAGTPTEVLKSDVNTRVKKALDAAGIEIPYPYYNIVAKKEDA